MPSDSIDRWIETTREHDVDQTFTYHSWVSTRGRWVAVTVPKVACTRIKLTLHLLEGGPDLEHVGTVHDQGTHLVHFETPEVVEMLTSPSWFRFAFVRNPYGRLISAYKTQVGNTWNEQYRWLKTQIKDALGPAHGYPRDNEGPDRLVAFRDFVRYLVDAPERVRRDGHFNLQSRILAPDVIPYDVIGRLESFQRDFERVLRRLDAPPEIVATAAEVKNPTTKVHPAIPYDRELADLVYDLYRPDFERFGYDRDSWMYAEGWG
jgi:hypothetical protein